MFNLKGLILFITKECTEGSVDNTFIRRQMSSSAINDSFHHSDFFFYGSENELFVYNNIMEGKGILQQFKKLF